MFLFPTTQEEVNNLPFKILNKTSASPTLLIHNKNVDPQVVLKLWKKKEEPKYKALEYERRVYSEKINQIIREKEDSPFLKYVGEGNCSTFNDLVDYLGVKHNEKGKNFLNVALYIYGDVKKDFNYSELEAYESDEYVEFTAPSAVEKRKLNSVKVVSYECIILPYVEMITFSQALESYGTDRIIPIFKDIMKGLYMLYRKEVSHNDLHDDNIMLNPITDNVFIFDWDRSYCTEFGDNPILSKEVCKAALCRSSQCNLFHRDGYSIDFYKILYYVLSSRNDWRTILENIGINNVVLGATTLYDIIYKTIREHNGGFFNQEYWDEDEGDEVKCSWLQDRNLVRRNGTSMKFLHETLGDYRIIYMSSLDEDAEELKEPIPEDLMAEYRRLRGGASFAMLKVERHVNILHTLKPSKRKVVKKSSGKTWKDFLELRRRQYKSSRIVDNIVQWDNKISPISQSIVDIIVKNDERKVE